MPFRIIRNDITKVSADAIVNSGNPGPSVGRGSESAVYEAAGWQQLLKAREKLGVISPGEAAVTRGFDLPARYVIHTVVPYWEGGEYGELKTLEQCYEACLEAAKRKRMRSVAFPLLGAGTLGFPKDKALSAALAVIQRFLMETEMTVLLAVFDRESLALSEKLTEDIDAYIDDHYVERKTAEEYRYAAESAIRDEKYRADGNRRKARMDQIPRDESVSLNMLPGGAGPAGHELPDDADLYDMMPMAAPTMAKPEAQPSSSVKQKAAKKRSLDEALNEVGETFQQALFRIIRDRGYSETEVYKRANLDRKVFSKIRVNEQYSPKKSTAIALAIGLKLNLEESADLLSRAGYSFSPGSRADVIVQYFIENGIYNVLEIDSVLYEYGEHMLSSYA